MKEKQVGRSGLAEMQGKEKTISGIQEERAVRKPDRRSPGREGAGFGEQNRLSRRWGFVPGINQAVVATISPLSIAMVMVPMGVAGPFRNGPEGE